MKKSMKRLVMSLFVVAFTVAGCLLADNNPMTQPQTVYAAESVATVKADKASGTYYSDGALSVKLSCKTQGAKIYYSVDGGKYKEYTEALLVKKKVTIKAYANKGMV